MNNTELKSASTEQMIDEIAGRIIIGIGGNAYRSAVADAVLTILEIGFQRGVESTKKTKTKIWTKKSIKAEVLRIRHSKGFIDAIKRYRELTSSPLIDAKRYVDNLKG